MRIWNGFGLGQPMGHRSRLAGAVMLAVALAGGNALPAAADEAPAPQQPTPQVETAHHGVAVVTVVRARDLMSPDEQRAYRRSWREARTVAERQSLRQTTMERLQQRATEHGMVMVIETRVLRPTSRRAEPEPVRPGAPATPVARPLPPRAP